MEDETTEELTDSDYSDNFIASDDDNESGLTWDSEDSRPAGPSPPSSANMNNSPVVRLRPRLRHRGRRAVYIEPETQSDAESEAVSQVSVVDDPPSPTVSTFMIHDDTDSVQAISEEHNDSDETQFSVHSYSSTNNLSPSSSRQSPQYLVLPHPSQNVPRSPIYSSSQDEDTGGDVEVILHTRNNAEDFYQVRPVSPDYPPPQHTNQDETNVYNPISPAYSRRSNEGPDFPNHPPPQDNGPDRNPTSPVYSLRAAIDNEGPNQDAHIIEPPHHIEEVSNQQDPSENILHRSQPTKDASISKSTKPPSPCLNGTILSESDDNSLCTICMDPLTNSGKHRVVCLRCGHIFGHSCVERWIKVGCNNGAKRCPTCNKKACLKDIRVLYLPKVVPLDTVEKDRLIEEKEMLIAQKNAVEMQLSRCKLQNELNTKKYEEKIMKLEKELVKAVNAVELFNQGKKIVLPSIDVKKDGYRSELLHMVDISKEGGCRVMAFNPFLHELIVSHPSGNTIFAGFGVRVLSTVDFQPSRYVYLHTKMIRDLAFHLEDRDLLLSVSLDQTAKLVDLASSTTVHTFKGDGPLWSCCWDACNPHLLLTGSQLGKVCQYDRRMMDHCVNLWEDMQNHTPVVALAATPSVPLSPFPQGGFLSCRLNGVFAFARYGETYKSQELPLEGPFLNMRYDESKQTLLTTTRPSSRCPSAKISLNQVESDHQGNVYLPRIHTFSCGSSTRLMSRLTTLPVLNDSLVVAHHESGRTVNMWSSKTGNLVTSFPIKEPVIDLTPVSSTSNKCLLATLSDKRVGIYRVT